MKKLFLGALILITFNASYADEIPIARIVTWYDMEITYQINYLDKNDSLCYPTTEGTFRQPENADSTFDRSVPIYKLNSTPDSCTHAVVKVKSAFVYCEGKETYGNPPCSTNYLHTFNQNACSVATTTAGPTLSTKLIFVQDSGAVYSEQDSHLFYCTYGDQ